MITFTKRVCWRDIINTWIFKRLYSESHSTQLTEDVLMTTYFNVSIYHFSTITMLKMSREAGTDDDDLKRYSVIIAVIMNY